MRSSIATLNATGLTDQGELIIMALSSQTVQLHNYLRGTTRTLTAKQAEKKFSIRNLSARITELKDLGLRVRSTKTRTGEVKYAVSARDITGSRRSLITNS